jgi:urease beta subunit
MALAQQVQALVNAITALPAPVIQPCESSVVKIDPYYGDEQDPISWIEDFEKAATANNYTDARKLQIVAAHLKGTAATWLYDRQQNAATNPTTWVHNAGDNAAQIALTFRQPFINHFRTEAKICEWQQELTSHQQLAMTIEQYASKLRNLIRRVYPNGDLPVQAQISQFVQGLQPHLKFHVQTSSPQNLDQAIAAARRFETGYRQNQNSSFQMMYAPPTQPANEVTELTKALKSIQEQLDVLKVNNNRPRYNGNRPNWN